MMRRTALLSTLAATLTLAACNKQADTAASPPAQATPPAPVAPATAARTTHVWQAVGPLLAGSYQGSCALAPASAMQDATILLGPDGKAASGALQVDFRAADMALVKRARDSDGQYGTMASVAIDANSNAGGMFLLQAGRSDKETHVNFTRGDQTLLCTGVSGAGALNARPLYPTLLRLVTRKKQTIGCADLKNASVRKDADVEVGPGVIRIGAASFAMHDVVSEMLTLSEGGSKLMFSVELANQRSVILLYDGAGKLAAASHTNDEKFNQVCFAQGT